MRSQISHQTLRRMVHFAAVAGAGSIRGAARVLRLSPPVVSESLSELEAELGVTLAIRNTRAFRLTEAGQHVRNLTERMLALAEEAGEISNRDRPLDGSLSVTLPTEMATHWLPPHLDRFRREHTGVAVSIDANDGVVRLKDSAHDIAVRTANQALTSLSIAAPSWNTIPLACVTGRAVTACRDGAVVRVPLPLLTTETSTPRLEALDKESLQPLEVLFDDRIVINNKETARELARNGLGAVLILGISIDSRLQPVLPDVSFGSVVFDFMLRDRFPSPEAQAFLALFEGDRPADVV